MRKLLLILGISLFLYQTQAQNLVLNGGMEAWTSETTPTSWEKAESVAKEATVIKEGSFSAKQTAGTTDIQQDMIIEAGATYTISYWFLDNDANAKSRIWSYWLNGTSTIATDNTAELRPSVYSSDNAAWQQYSQTIVAPASATGFRFEVRTYSEGAGGGNIYYDGFSVIKQGGSASTSTDILSFSVPGQQGTSVIDNTAGTISFTMTTGTDVSALVPTITLATGATISPASGVAQNFSSPVNYVVTAQDGTTKKNFTVSVNYSSVITLLYENFETLTNNIDVALTGWSNINEVGSRKWIGKSFSSNLYAQFSSYSTSAPEANTAWLITPEVDLDNSVDEVFSFKVNTGYYTHNGLAVLLSQNFDGTNVASATWEDITSSFNIPQTPTSGYGTLTKAGEKSLASYSGKVHLAFKYVGDGTATKTTTYQIDSVIVKGSPNASSETDIEAFSVNNQFGESIIDNTNHTVKAEVLSGTSLTALVPQFSLSTGATIAPASGVAQDFSNPVVYLVTAQDGLTQQEWTVTVSQAVVLSDLADITAFSFENEVEPADINLADTTITALLPWDATLMALTPSITVSAGAQVTPTVAQDFINPVIYTVTAQNGVNKKHWKVSVSLMARPSSATDILGFKFDAQSKDELINKDAKTVTCQVKYGTSLTALTPIVTVSDSATYTPSGAQDFTQPVKYTVNAADGITSTEWTVTVTVAPMTIVSLYDIQHTTDASGASSYANTVVTTRGVVTALKSKGFFMQDGEGAWNGVWVYLGATPTVQIKDSVLVTGKIIEYFGLTEMEKPTTVTIINSNNTLPAPAAISVADFKEAYEGVLVKLTNMVCADTAGLAKYKSWLIVEGNDSVYVDDDMYYLPAVEGQTFDQITGIGTYAFDYYRILPRDVADVTAIGDEQALNKVVIFPNPVNNELYLANLDGVNRIVITNIIGQVVYQTSVFGESYQINTSDFMKGLYIVTFESGNREKYSVKIVKN